MAKYKNKVQAALAARRKSYDAMPVGKTKDGMQRPGSQNRKKGYGSGNGRR